MGWLVASPDPGGAPVDRRTRPLLSRRRAGARSLARLITKSLASYPLSAPSVTARPGRHGGRSGRARPAVRHRPTPASPGCRRSGRTGLHQAVADRARLGLHAGPLDATGHQGQSSTRGSRSTLLALEVSRYVRPPSLRSSRSSSPPRACLGLKFFMLAHASIKVPSTENARSRSRRFTRGSAGAAAKNLTAMSPSSSRSQFLEKLDRPRRLIDPQPDEPANSRSNSAAPSLALPADQVDACSSIARSSISGEIDGQPSPIKSGKVTDRAASAGPTASRFARSGRSTAPAAPGPRTERLARPLLRPAHHRPRPITMAESKSPTAGHATFFNSLLGQCSWPLGRLFRLPCQLTNRRRLGIARGRTRTRRFQGKSTG